MLKHWKHVGVTNETIGNRQLALNQIHSYIYIYIYIHIYTSFKIYIYTSYM